jgi:hypothetical protein
VDSRFDPTREFLDAVAQADAAWLSAELELADEAMNVVREGVAALPDPVRAACGVVLNDWPRLGPAARVAALLVFANALARQL